MELTSPLNVGNATRKTKPSIISFRGIVVSALAWHSLGREIEFCPGIRECFPLDTL